MRRLGRAPCSRGAHRPGSPSPALCHLPALLCLRRRGCEPGVAYVPAMCQALGTVLISWCPSTTGGSEDTSPGTAGATCSGRCPSSSPGWYGSRMCLVYPSVFGEGERCEPAVGARSAGSKPEREGLAHPVPRQVCPEWRSQSSRAGFRTFGRLIPSKCAGVILVLRRKPCRETVEITVKGSGHKMELESRASVASW